VRIREAFHRHREAIVLTVLAIVSIVSLGVNTESFSLRPKQVGQSFVAIFQQGASGIGRFFSGTVNSIRELSVLRDEYDDLLARVEEYETLTESVELLRSENERLRSALGFSESLDYENIPARVVAKEPGSFFAGFTINKGSLAGVQRNMPVIAGQRGVAGLVGRVDEVGLTTSIIMPIFDADSFVAARLQRSRHEGLVSGDTVTPGELTLLYVDKAARSAISVDDLVITSGMRSLFPEGIYIGRVSTIQGRPYETSLSIGLEPVVDFSVLEYVFVVAEDSQ
jgi:rod shape-determining protein MreC